MEKQSDRWVISLVAPEGKPPTLDTHVLDKLQEALSSIEDAVSRFETGLPHLVVLQSISPKYFCVGANIAVLKTLTEKTMPEWVRRGHAVLNQLEDLPIPVIAKVRGYALGGGLELAMACDLIVCDESAKLGQTEANLGFVPGWGGSLRLPRRVGVAPAKRLFYTGEVLPAVTALSMGLVDVVEPEGNLDRWVDQFAATLAGKSPVALRGFKRVLNEAEYAARESNALAEHKYSLNCITNPDTHKRIGEFLNKPK